MEKKIRIFYLLTVKRVRNFKLQKKYFVFLFFLFLSTIFWFLNALAKQYNSFIEVPYEFINTFNNQALIQNKTSIGNLTVQINARGFSILDFNTTIFKNTIKIKSDSRYVNRMKTDSVSYFVRTSKLKNLISAHIGDNFKIIAIRPDSLFFLYENIQTKKVPVKSNIKLSLKQQFFQTTPERIIPDSIIISGSRQLLEKIAFVQTEEYEFFSIDNHLDLTCELQEISGISFSIPRVKVFVPIEEFTEKTMQIPIEIVNLPSQYDLQLFPQNIHIQFNISISNYLKVKAEDFKFTVDYKEIMENSKTLRVNLENTSKFAFNLDFSPQRVEYILEK